MKRTLCLLAALLLLLPLTACAEPAAAAEPTLAQELAAKGYNVLLVTDVFTAEDTEPTEDAELTEEVEPTEDAEPTDDAADGSAETAAQVVVQGQFGSIDYSQSEADPEFDGFEETVSLSLAEGCVIELPGDMLEPLENEVCLDLQAWYDRESSRDDDYEPLSFYAAFTLDENGDLTSLTYTYYPWG